MFRKFILAAAALTLLTFGQPHRALAQDANTNNTGGNDNNNGGNNNNNGNSGNGGPSTPWKPPGRR